MNVAEVIAKADRGEGLTEEEVKIYKANVKPVHHTYGKYGTLARIFLEKHAVGKYWALADDLPEYLHGIDKAADDIWDTMYVKLKNAPQYKKTGDFMHDLQIETEIHRLIEEEILNEIVYVY